jgi:hypothetical protein
MQVMDRIARYIIVTMLMVSNRPEHEFVSSLITRKRLIMLIIRRPTNKAIEIL